MAVSCMKGLDGEKWRGARRLGCGYITIPPSPPLIEEPTADLGAKRGKLEVIWLAGKKVGKSLFQRVSSLFDGGCKDYTKR